MPEKEILETIETYNIFAEKYSQIYGSIDIIKNLLDYFVDNLNGNKIIDIGCGPGRDAKYFHELGFNVTGIDLSKKLLKILKNNSSGLELCLADMRNLNFKDDCFDGIWACASFLHIPKKHAKSTLQEFYRILKPNGLMFICVLEGEGENLVKTPRFGKQKRFFADYSISKFEDLIQSADFTIIKKIIEPKKEVTWINVFARPKY